MKVINSLVLVVLIIGGLNWGAIGLLNVDLVAALFGGTVGPRSSLSNFVYIIVGAAALYGIYLLKPLSVGSDVVDGDPHLDRRPPN